MRRLLFLVILALSASRVSAGPLHVIVTFREASSVATPEGARVQERFRDDLAALATPSALPAAPRVRREYKRVLSGAAVELRGSADVRAIAALPYVESVLPDAEVTAFESGTRAVRDVAPLSNGGAGIVIAVIDSGIDYRHPALGGAIGPERKVRGGWDFVNDDADPMDDYRHGTHVAGIAAGDSNEVRGVAPAAALLAYKVLDASGKGRASDIIAALERALDPNGDGDLSDRADVANISIGGPGHADDPLARAVNVAVAAGMVVCVAAGNEGAYHEIGSPGSADGAITVGASDGTTAVADFSSMGPARGTGAIKPDLLAPGVGIRSAAIGGGTLVLSGTSMASPYVAGIAALLVAEHPEWTPARVKSAIVATALPLDGVDAMTQGAGIVSLAGAVSHRVSTSSSQVFFGLDATKAQAWTATRTIRLQNESPDAQPVVVAIENPWPAVTMTAAPAALVLARGEAKDVTFSIEVDHAKLDLPPPGSFALDGAVRFEGAGVRLPWAFLRAGRVVVAHEVEFPRVSFFSSTARYLSARPIATNAVEALLEPARYDIVTIADRDGDTSVVIREDIDIEGDVRIDVTSADADRVVTLRAATEAGEEFPFTETPTRFYRNIVRLLAPGEFSLELPRLAGKTVRASSYSDRFALLASEFLLDASSRRAYVAQHPPLRGLDGNRVLAIGGGSYASTPIHVRFPDGVAKRELVLLSRDVTRRFEEAGRDPLGLLIENAPLEWSGSLFMTPEVADGYAAGLNVLAFTDHPAVEPALPSFASAVLRRDNAGFFAVRGYEPPPEALRAQGERWIGRGPVIGRFLGAADAAFIAGELDMVGEAQESRRIERMTAQYRVIDRTGAVASFGKVLYGTFFAPVPPLGAARVEFTTDSYMLDGRSGSAKLEVAFDPANTSARPPVFTSLEILGSDGSSATTLSNAGSLVFSVADYDAQRSSQPIPDARTTVFFRRRGTSSWVQLTPQKVSEESGPEEDFGRIAFGSIYRVDLRDALIREGEIELAIEAYDSDGNRATYQLAPAFVVEKRSARRRAVRP